MLDVIGWFTIEYLIDIEQSLHSQHLAAKPRPTANRSLHVAARSGMPKWRSISRASLSFSAVVTKVMFMPWL